MGRKRPKIPGSMEAGNDLNSMLRCKPAKRSILRRISNSRPSRSGSVSWIASEIFRQRLVQRAVTTKNPASQAAARTNGRRGSRFQAAASRSELEVVADSAVVRSVEYWYEASVNG